VGESDEEVSGSGRSACSPSNDVCRILVLVVECVRIQPYIVAIRC